MKKKPKGTELTSLDVCITSVDGEPIWRQKQSILGSELRDKDGEIIEGVEKLTRRRVILLALALDPQEDIHNADAKLKAGHFQRVFWKDEKVEVDSEDITFIKNRVNNRFNGSIYFILCEYLEGVETPKVETESATE